MSGRVDVKSFATKWQENVKLTACPKNDPISLNFDLYSFILLLVQINRILFDSTPKELFLVNFNNHLEVPICIMLYVKSTQENVKPIHLDKSRSHFNTFKRKWALLQMCEKYSESRVLLLLGVNTNHLCLHNQLHFRLHILYFVEGCKLSAPITVDVATLSWNKVQWSFNAICYELSIPIF